MSTRRALVLPSTSSFACHSGISLGLDVGVVSLSLEQLEDDEEDIELVARRRFALRHAGEGDISAMKL